MTLRQTWYVICLIPGWLRVAFTLLVELFKATWGVLRMVYAPLSTPLRPGILAVPLDTQSDVGITTFANMITLTPGTTTLDVADDRSQLYVHALNISDPEQEAADMKSSLEADVKKVWP